MGCDIHTIVEIRQNGQWKYVPELPEEFDGRSYGVFSILNKNVRNYNGINGFEGKGVPKDVSGKHFRFISHRKELETSYQRKTTVCRTPNNEYISPYSELLRTEVDKETYDKIIEELLEYTKEDEQLYRYFTAITNPVKNSYFVQDAQKVNGQFVELPFSEIYKTIDEFNQVFYNYTWYEAEQDYGYYEVDFENNSLHSCSYLSLSELKTKVTCFLSKKSFIVERDFLNHLEMELGEFPDTMFIENIDEKAAKVIFATDSDMLYSYERYNNGVKELEKIKNLYKIDNNDDIRIVFGFDS